MSGYELDLKSPDFQTLMGTNASRVTPGKGVDRGGGIYSLTL
jgi:hypothetical protein